MTSVLLIEDEPVFSAAVTASLQNEGFDVLVAGTGAEGLAAIADSKPAVVLLDLRLPDCDGFDVCRQIRQQSKVPIIILSARNDDMDKVLGLELGADDYVTKDASKRELAARVRAVLRRSVGSSESHAWVAGHVVDRKSRSVTRPDGDVVNLTQLEFDLLEYLVKSPGEVHSREHLFNAVWHQQNLGSSRTIDAHVNVLRSKLPGVTIVPIRGVGYRYETD